MHKCIFERADAGRNNILYLGVMKAINRFSYAICAVINRSLAHDSVLFAPVNGHSNASAAANRWTLERAQFQLKGGIRPFLPNVFFSFIFYFDSFGRGISNTRWESYFIRLLRQPTWFQTWMQSETNVWRAPCTRCSAKQTERRDKDRSGWK